MKLSLYSKWELVSCSFVDLVYAEAEFSWEKSSVLCTLESTVRCGVIVTFWNYLLIEQRTGVGLWADPGPRAGRPRTVAQSAVGEIKTTPSLAVLDPCGVRPTLASWKPLDQSAVWICDARC